ncbi:hypothetical protein ANCDUO_15597 [Ancylostoma duodenale]|uniref:Uncharacterized protein n=1 Tax=Ancylostoma duodenale TaxID=51022 RepID=A0A0C2CD53_9BILA|nr:hypothetical protein ANCDUO_15597 [Ancylostoma duodenale]
MCDNSGKTTGAGVVVQDGLCCDRVRFHPLPDECVYDHAQLRPPLCSAIEAGSSVAEWERLNEQQIQKDGDRNLNYVVVSKQRSSIRVCVLDQRLRYLILASSFAFRITQSLTLETKDLSFTYGTLTYHAVASSDLLANPFALRFDGKNFQKISEG